MTLGQAIEVGPFTFTFIRVLIVAGLVRVILRSERLPYGLNRMDWLMLLWSAWAIVSSFFHRDYMSALVLRLGLTYNALGIYFLIRVFCQSLDDVKDLCRFTAIFLLPVAAEMIYEHVASHNLFSVLGGVNETPVIREGRIRASGPFAHPILAGTVGAVSLPLIIGFWPQYRKTAFVGIAVCFTMIFTSASSGPVLSAMIAIAALFSWHYRQHMRLLRWVAVFGYIALEVVMNANAYYILSRLNLVGGSTGWVRAYLIETAFQHLDEWWLAGTDSTMHWMPYQRGWGDHADITNQYITFGVMGGLPLMLLFIVMLSQGFIFVGQMVRQATDLTHEFRFMIWALGASLFAHVAAFMSVSYFDQSFLFLYLTLAGICSSSFIINPHSCPVKN